MKLSFVPATLALAAVTLCAHAFAAPADKTQASTAHTDTEFLKKASQGNFNEIDLAQLVLKKATDDDVKAFAQKMIDDHTKLSESMKPFAMEAGLEPPTHADAAALASKAKLELLSGKAFDKAYIKDMVEDHHKDLQEFIAEKNATGYPAFKTAVEKGEEVIKGHMEMINTLAKKNGIAPAPVPAGA